MSARRPCPAPLTCHVMSCHVMSCHVMSYAMCMSCSASITTDLERWFFTSEFNMDVTSAITPIHYREWTRAIAGEETDVHRHGHGHGHGHGHTHAPHMRTEMRRVCSCMWRGYLTLTCLYMSMSTDNNLTSPSTRHTTTSTASSKFQSAFNAQIEVWRREKEEQRSM